MAVWTDLISWLRAGLLCAIVAAGLTPERATAHDARGSAEAGSHAYGHATDHAPHAHPPAASQDTAHSLIVEAFGDCHQGIDCALNAMVAPHHRLTLRFSITPAARHPAPRRRAGIAHAYEPPPPRSFI